MFADHNLGLNEALVTVDSSALQNQLVDVYYKINECLGCPFEKFKSLNSNLEDFRISTKHVVFFEFRQQETNELLCKLNNLNLNDHGQYKIDVISSPTRQASSNLTEPNCTFQTLEKGSCLLCPVAMLLTLLLLITIGEKLLLKCFALKDDKSKGTKHRNSRSQERLEVDESQPQHEQQPQVNAGEPELAADGEETAEDAIAPADNGAAANQQIETTEHKSARIDALDAFRGLTIAGMIMVNYGGAGYSQLEHKAWDGITLADFVFPFFIFSMGASIAISTKSMINRGKPFFYMLKRVFQRSLILMVLGLCLNSKWLNGKDLHHLRVTGVLQRFSISYLVVASMFAVELTLNKWIKAQSLYRIPVLSRILVVSLELLTALNHFTIYIYVTFYFDYSSSCPVGYVGPGGQTENGLYANCTGGAAAWLDRLILGENHLYNDHEVKEIFRTKVTHDPEGILGNTTSILLTLIGLQCGKILLRFKNHRTRLFLFTQWMAILGICCVSVIMIPINKRLWSLTFILVTGTVAYATMIILYLILDVLQCKRTFLLKLIISAGRNSIFLYVGHSLLSGMLPWHFAIPNEASHMQLLFRLTWSAFMWLLIAHYMDYKKLYIRL